MSTRVCCDCKIAKPLSDYYKCKKCRCKLCEAARVRRHRAANVDYFRAYDRGRRTKEFVTAEEWAEHIKVRYSRTVKYREENPKKWSAHQKVGKAIRSGQLVPQPCEQCGNTDVHGHHDDYDKPLEVRWLCSEHHIAWHLENGEGANAH